MIIAQLTTDNRECFRQYGQPSPWFGTAPEALFQGFAQMPEVKIHVVSCTQRPLQSPEKLADNIWFHSLHVPKFGWLRTGYQGCIRAVRRKLREIHPDLVHGQGTERDCSISAVLSGFPNVLTIHGNMRLVAQINRSRPFSFGWLAARLEGFTVPRSDGIVCITRYTQNAVAADAPRTWVVPNAVDQSFFAIQPAPATPVEILCVGNICHRKNQLALVQALEPLREKHEFNLVFLGGYEQTDSYAEEFFRAVKARPWCRYEGFAGRPKLKEHFQRASVLVLASLEDNCPMVVLEAMAARVPVVASKVGGLPDLVEDGCTGLFCDPLEEASIRQPVERLLEESSLREELREQAFATAQIRFHPLAIARRHLEIYREVLKSRS